MLPVFWCTAVALGVKSGILGMHAARSAYGRRLSLFCSGSKRNVQAGAGNRIILCSFSVAFVFLRCRIQLGLQLGVGTWYPIPCRHASARSSAVAPPSRKRAIAATFSNTARASLYTSMVLKQVNGSSLCVLELGLFKHWFNVLKHCTMLLESTVCQ